MNEPASVDDLRVASKILALAAAPALRPVDFLVAESQLARDRRWFTRAFEEVAATELGDAVPAAEGDPSEWHERAPAPAALDAWRARAKFAFEAAGDVHARNAALLVYAWSIAASLVHHGRLASTQPREDLDQLLAEIATVIPEPHASLPRRALHVVVEDEHRRGR